MGEIVGKLADSLSMFWQALDEQERRLVIVGAVWIVAMAANVPLEQRRRRSERDEIAAQVLAELRSAHG